VPESQAIARPPSRILPIPTWARWSIGSGAVVLVLDQASKWWLQSLVPGGAMQSVRPEHWPSWMEWHHNPGVAWGMFGSMPWLVGVLTLVLIPVLAVVWWRSWRGSRTENLGAGLVLGGAIGNAIDRALAMAGQLAGVRDFIHVDLGFPPFDPWPTFNIADAGICAGFALLVVHGLVPRRSRERTA
jgi:signal peptidase II